MVRQYIAVRGHELLEEFVKIGEGNGGKYRRLARHFTVSGQKGGFTRRNNDQLSPVGCS